jgi:hypothetical protein
MIKLVGNSRVKKNQGGKPVKWFHTYLPPVADSIIFFKLKMIKKSIKKN